MTAEAATTASLSNLLTHSRMQAFRTCPRKHFYSYELGLRPKDTTRPLRFGKVFHWGLDQRAQGVPAEDIYRAVLQMYRDAAQPEYLSEHEWMVEAYTVATLLNGYCWFYQEEPLELVQTEFTFRHKIRNPGTTGISLVWQAAGKVDKIAKLQDGRMALVEHKTTSQDINPNSDYWRRLRMDQQVSHYTIAAHEENYPVETTLYDAIRKPGIQPRQIPEVDEEGCKIVIEETTGARVLNQNGTSRQSADKAKGWSLVTRVESPEEYAARLHDDIQNRPEFYFQRMEIARLESDLDEYRQELWDTQKTIQQARHFNRWPRNTQACLSPFKCPYFDLCCQGIKPSRAEAAPEGFEFVDDVHPELSEGDEL